MQQSQHASMMNSGDPIPLSKVPEKHDDKST